MICCAQMQGGRESNYGDEWVSTNLLQSPSLLVQRYGECSDLLLSPLPTGLPRAEVPIPSHLPRTALLQGRHPLFAGGGHCALPAPSVFSPSTGRWLRGLFPQQAVDKRPKYAIVLATAGAHRLLSKKGTNVSCICTSIHSIKCSHTSLLESGIAFRPPSHVIAK